MRGLVPAEPLDRRPGPAGLSRGQRVAPLRRHLLGLRPVPDPDAQAQAHRGRGRVRRAPGARGGRGRRGRPRRPTGLPVLPGRVSVLCGARPAPGPVPGPAPARRMLRRRVPPENVPAGFGGAHRVCRSGLGHVLQRLGRSTRWRDRMLRRPGMGLFDGHRYHGGRVHAGQGDWPHRAGRLRRLRRTVRQQIHQ